MRTEQVARWIESANSGWTAEEVFAGVERGDFHLWLHPEGCVVTEFIVSPRHRALHAWAMGGSLSALHDLLPQIEQFGRDHGCDLGGATGRKGWVRFAQKYGYASAAPSVMKEL